ncbi:MAG TPA: hypothetical protein VFW03_26505 [Gemmatimonadaceae bacterium]|nr:hypothetical protein [Gemmatimonadaceae bacterium]
MEIHPRQTEIAFILVGLVAVGIAAARVLFPVEYAPGDPRAEDWFYPVTSAAFALAGLFFVVVGIARLVRRRND